MAENQNQTSEAEEQRPANILTEPSIGMVYDKEQKQSQVFSQNPDGTFKTVEPTPENEDLFFQMKNNIPENFIANLRKYHENPTVNIYVFPRRILDHMKEALKGYWTRTPAKAAKLLYNYKIRPNGDFECKMKTYGIRDNEIPWDTLARYGLSYGMLEKSGNLERLRNYEPTSMLKLNYLDDVLRMAGDAKLRLKGKGDHVKVDLKFSTRTPEKQLFSVPFSDEDMKNLAQTGNLGHVFSTPKGDFLVSRDFDTQQLEITPADKVFVSQYLYGKQLDQTQIDTFKRGEAQLIQGMKGPNGPFDAMMQYNAVYRKVMEVLTPQQRTQLARDLSKRNEIEQIISRPPSEINGQAQRQAAQEQTTPPAGEEQPAPGVTPPGKEQKPGQIQNPKDQEPKPAPRPQVATPQTQSGTKHGKHV